MLQAFGAGFEGINGACSAFNLHVNARLNQLQADSGARVIGLR